MEAMSKWNLLVGVYALQVIRFNAEINVPAGQEENLQMCPRNLECVGGKLRKGNP